MAQYYYKQVNVRFGPGSLTPVVRNLLIANVAVFVLQLMFSKVPIGGDPDFLVHHFGIIPGKYIQNTYQVFTYMFLHALQRRPMHIVFNMLYLWMFGVDVEKRLGSRSFAWMYFICGVGAGVLSAVFFAIMNLMTGNAGPVIGASGAIFGVMLAYGLLFPERMILLFFILPIKAIYLVMFMIAAEVVYLVTGAAGNVAHIAHVSGALFAYLYLLNEKAIMKSAPRADAIQRVREKIETISEAEEQRRIDDILDKINREGMHKLSRNERAFLRRRAAKRRQD